MWLVFEDIQYRTDLTSKKGDTYSGYVVTGTKKGWQDEPDSPYSKIIFENVMTNVVEDNDSVEMALYEFFQSCKSGDLVVVNSVKDGKFWKIESVENKNRKILSGVVKSEPSSSSDSSLIAATVFVNTLVNNGHYQDKTQPKVLMEAVKAYKQMLEQETLVTDQDVLSELEEAE